MTDSPMVGGKRRIDFVLAAGFAEDLEPLEIEEIRRRRDLARAELEYLSLLRRLVQGRQDILRAELERRHGEGEPAPLVDRLVEILSEGGRGPSRGEAPRVSLPEEEVALSRRRVERLVADAGLSDLDGLSDDDLEAAIRRLEEAERSVSDTRAGVIEVHDTLQAEVKRRYRDRLSPQG